ncbi:helix-turn-helix domain-containing protein [Arcanobacterium wilhelmae]|nr:helix-turn-helix domain-containing protein [Arcanobacterium wilhelmae]WFN90454.1 helix-turn-helix domain-containing protein [Arcanobacterium wilhelmae]
MKLHETHKNGDSDLLNTKEAAALLPSTSEATLARWARQGKIPAVVLPSGRRFFRREDIESILTPVSEVTEEAHNTITTDAALGEESVDPNQGELF